MRKNKKWILTAEIDNIEVIRLRDVDLIIAKKDGFDSRDECIRGLLTINHLFPKKGAKKFIDFLDYFKYNLTRYCAIISWIPLFGVPYNPGERLKSIGFTHFISEIKEGKKKQTIRFQLPDFVEGEIVWLAEYIKKDKNVESKEKSKNLLDYFK